MKINAANVHDSQSFLLLTMILQKQIGPTLVKLVEPLPYFTTAMPQYLPPVLFQ